MTTKKLLSDKNGTQVFYVEDGDLGYVEYNDHDGHFRTEPAKFYPILQDMKILAATPNALGLIETAGRVCYKSEPKGDPDSFIRARIKQGHTSILEHAVFTVMLHTDRDIATEFTRHRHTAFNPGVSQESTRYVDYNGHGVCIVPPDDRPDWTSEQRYRYWMKWIKTGNTAADDYADLRSDGIKPEDARRLLPGSTAVEMVFTASMREWRSVFQQRVDGAAHHQIRALLRPMLKECKERWPVLFEDVELASE